MLPVLYSFRRCPYAMRARMAIRHNKVACELREVVLKNKPAELLAASAKATVPVLNTGEVVIDESIDIMAWAIQNGISSWQQDHLKHHLVVRNDGEFKSNLDRYKYFDRFPEFSQSHYFKAALDFLNELEAFLSLSPDGQLSLLDTGESALDVAIFPFIRQLAFVDKPFFDSQDLPKLQAWLDQQLNSELFAGVMSKYPAWNTEQKERIIFGV